MLSLLKLQKHIGPIYQRRRFSTNSSEGLQKPSDWRNLSNNAISKVDKILKTLLLNQQDAEKVVRDFDDISETLCKVVDPAELCRNVHSSKQFREAASEVVETISNYINQLNTNYDLYSALTRVTKDKTLFNKLSDEAKLVSLQLEREFELNGVHLTLNQRNNIIELQSDIYQLSNLYMENLSSSTKSIKIPSSFSSQFPSFLLNVLHKDNKYIYISDEPHLINSVLENVRDSQVRSFAYLHGNTVNKDNLQVLNTLVIKRNQLANILGYPSYAELTLAGNRVATSPVQVLEFLDNLSAALKPKITSELRMLSTKKQQMEGISDIYAWDKLFYTKQCKSEIFDIGTSHIPHYLSIEDSLSGLNMVLNKVFGMHFREVPMEVNESWHPSVKKLAVYSNSEKSSMGHVYLDLLPRNGKFSHAATFTINLSKVNSEGNLIETPKVALVCNLGGHNKSLLSHHDIETLFHEFGHCLSALLSRTSYQHVAGTRAALDFIETPSTLLENFVWNPQVLQSFAKHYKTREIIPNHILNRLSQSRYLFAGIDLQQQICYSAFDLLIYKQPNTSIESTMQLMQDLHIKYMDIPYVQDTHYHTQFGHLVNYASGYYSYLYCKNFSSNIWNYYFKEDPFNKAAGIELTRKMFNAGGALNPSVILTNLLNGDPPLVDNFIAEINNSPNVVTK